ncbi:hypothetical protein Pan216_01450 [Planctomycetes bacterium Pan216]|uniref:Glycosyltransferase RgtA/B/C/D-like domain-containing protein n=1 Tax=Kolteria novifilia TaxID=2527975 RepID=A0A518AX49_9BACT|nr:hypothetical protein Pan216_01450 [Planctomycetes bacterium Pan216]
MLFRLALAEAALRWAPAPFADSELYEAYARRIYEGEPYRLGETAAIRTPGYPALIAGCWWIAGGQHLRAVLWAQALLGTVTCWFVLAIGRECERMGFPRGTALLALLVAALDPYAALLGAVELSETAFTMLLMATAWLAIRHLDRPSFLAGAAMGVLAGLATLVRPSVLLLTPLSASWFLGATHHRRASLTTLVGSLVGLLLTMAPWIVRNALVLGAWVPTTTNVGESLYDGVGPQATGASDMRFKVEADLAGMNELEQDRYWRDESIEAMRAEPLRVVSLSAIKLWRFWSPWPNAAQYQRPLPIVVGTLASVPIYGLALVGIWSQRRRWRLMALCLLPAVYFSLLHMVFVSSIRYRVPAMPLVDILAGAGAVVLYAAWFQAAGPRTTPVQEG